MRIAIAGYGVEGRDNYRYWKNLGFNPVIVDINRELEKDLPSDAEYILGPNCFKALEHFDLVVRTAGLAPRKIFTKGKIWSATNEFFAKCPAKIIGITGTKGKGTTSSFITEILKSSGKKVHLVGNIGVPALSVLDDINPEDIVVYEMSSFQLWDLERSPDVAVVLMIEPDHLDVHSDFNEYVEAKSNIAKHQSKDDIVVYYSKNEYSNKIAEESQGKKVSYPVELSKEIISAIKIPGAHNVENASAAVCAVRAIMPDLEDEIIAQGLGNFTGLPHRLKFVAEIDGVKFYDDSISTTAGSAIAAIKSFDNPKILILGGHDKGADYSDLAKEIKKSNIRKVVISGANRSKIYHSLSEAEIDNDLVLEEDLAMSDVVDFAKDIAIPGDVVIFSPAAASFDRYRNYSERGEDFVKHVLKNSQPL